MRTFIVSLAVVCLSAGLANAQFEDKQGRLLCRIAADDSIVLTAAKGPINTAGLDFNAPDGGLSNPEGALDGFAFLLANTENKVTYGALAPLTIDGSLTLSTKYSGHPLDLSWSWGDGATPIGSSCGLPEPASSRMATFGLLGFLGFRRQCRNASRRRSSC